MSKANPVNPESVPIFVVGNKCDLGDQRKIRIEQALDFCKRNGDMHYIETSAKDNLNVEKLFADLAVKVVARQEQIALAEKTNKGGNDTEKKAVSMNDRRKDKNQ